MKFVMAGLLFAYPPPRENVAGYVHQLPDLQVCLINSVFSVQLEDLILCEVVCEAWKARDG